MVAAHRPLRLPGKPRVKRKPKGIRPLLVARGEADAPDIDGRVYIQGRLPAGQFARNASAISSTSRKTPCVDGCCGPMLMIMVWSLAPLLPCFCASAKTSSRPGLIMSGAAIAI